MSGIEQNHYDLKISSFPRIHTTLIGMNSDGYRINGGIGFSISEPKIHINFKIARNFIITDKRLKGFSTSEIDRFCLKINKISNDFGFKISTECTIYGESMTHFGMGTSTVTYLSCIEALFILNGAEYDINLIQSISSRGGTSGIGINTYFNGGFILDVGISNDSKNTLLPSSVFNEGNKLPLILSQGPTPAWKIGVTLPLNINSKTESEEIEFFKKTCPISKQEVESILYLSVYGVISSFLEENFNIFCDSVNAIQKTKWKKEERNLYNTKIEEIENRLFNNGALGVGMSSLGPGLYFMVDENFEKQNIIEFKDLRTFFTEMNNEPRSIKYA